MTIRAPVKQTRFIEVLLQHLDVPDPQPKTVALNGVTVSKWSLIETDLWVVQYAIEDDALLGIVASKRHPEIPPRGFRIDIRDIFGPCGEKMVHDFRTLENSGNIS